MRAKNGIQKGGFTHVRLPCVPLSGYIAVVNEEEQPPMSPTVTCRFSNSSLPSSACGVVTGASGMEARREGSSAASQSTFSLTFGFQCFNFLSSC